MIDAANLNRSSRPEPGKSGTPRIQELDALRGLAAVAVVLFHYTTRFDQLFGHSEPVGLSAPAGHFGVDLFFMLSGFVILMTLERSSDAWKFTWGRFSRLYPSYWAAALITFAAVAAFGLPGHDVTLAQAAINVTMLQGLLNTPHIDGAYWSLQAELIFYANMLLLFRLGAFRRTEWTVIAWVGISLLLGWAQPHLQQSFPVAGSLLAKFTTIACLKFIPLFGFGLLLYRRQHAQSQSHLSWIALLVCVAAIAMTDGLYAAMVGALLASTLWLAISGRLPALTASPLVWLGAISYTLYLTHQNIGYILIRNLESFGVSPIASIGFALLTSIVLAHTLHVCVERPSMKWLRRARLPSIPVRAFTVSAKS